MNDTDTRSATIQDAPPRPGTWDDIERRVGKFYVARQLFGVARLDVLYSLFNSLLITRCELVYYSDSFEYIAHSPFFDILSDAEIVPTYRVIGDCENGFIVQWRFERMK